MNEREILIELAKSGIEAVLPRNFIPDVIKNNEKSLSFFDWEGKEVFSILKKDFKNLHLFSVGKASYEMFFETLKVLKGYNIKDGLIVTNEERKSFNGFKIITSSHPIPDDRSVFAAKEVINRFRELKSDDFFIFLLSGGGSSLLEFPIEPITIYDLKKATELFLKSGMDIFELNTLRKHLSQIKGGKLAKFTNSRGVVLVLSDVIGDDLQFISSGLLYCDKTTYKDVDEILGKYNLWDKLPESVRDVFIRGIEGEIEDTPVFESDKIENIVVANNTFALKRIKQKCEDFNIDGKIVTSSLRGEAKEVVKVLVSMAEGILKEIDTDFKFPICLIFGGETTVNVQGNGIGGRNEELVLSGLNEIRNRKNIALLSIGTDGIDGKSEAAGGVVNWENFEIAKRKKLNLNSFLKNNDSYNFLKETNGLIITGKTGTNVCDIILLLISK